MAKKFTVPAKLYIGKDSFGRLEATDDDYGKLATIKVNQHNGVLGACDVDSYLANLRNKALRAYRDGITEIEA
jgi:hypothetical protein